jgi:hypothetical protein
VLNKNDVWAAGTYFDNQSLTGRALLLHWDGKEWSAHAYEETGNWDSSFDRIVGLSHDRVWAFLAVEQGGSSSIPRTIPLSLRLHRAPLESEPGGINLHEVQSVTIGRNGDVWAFGGSMSQGYGVVRRSGSGDWQRIPSAGEHILSYSSATSPAVDNVWLAGQKVADHQPVSFLMRWDGKRWAELPTPNPSTIQSVEHIEGAAKDDVWLIGTSRNASADSISHTMVAHFVPCK